jgi:macrolide-specific efflux system membrane fusion protein
MSREERRSTGAARAASGSTSGFANDTPRAPRRATVRLLTADGTLEDRPVTLGVSNRVQTQVLSGLAEGDQVVAGIKLPPAVERNGTQNTSGGLQQNPAGMPPGMGGPGQRGR